MHCHHHIHHTCYRKKRESYRFKDMKVKILCLQLKSVPVS